MDPLAQSFACVGGRLAVTAGGAVALVVLVIETIVFFADLSATWAVGVPVARWLGLSPKPPGTAGRLAARHACRAAAAGAAAFGWMAGALWHAGAQNAPQKAAALRWVLSSSDCAAEAEVPGWSCPPGIWPPPTPPSPRNPAPTPEPVAYFVWVPTPQGPYGVELNGLETDAALADLTPWLAQRLRETLHKAQPVPKTLWSADPEEPQRSAILFVLLGGFLAARACGLGILDQAARAWTAARQKRPVALVDGLAVCAALGLILALAARVSAGGFAPFFA